MSSMKLRSGAELPRPSAANGILPSIMDVTTPNSAAGSATALLTDDNSVPVDSAVRPPGLPGLVGDRDTDRHTFHSSPSSRASGGDDSLEDSDPDTTARFETQPRLTPPHNSENTVSKWRYVGPPTFGACYNSDTVITNQPTSRNSSPLPVSLAARTSAVDFELPWMQWQQEPLDRRRRRLEEERAELAEQRDAENDAIVEQSIRLEQRETSLNRREAAIADREETRRSEETKLHRRRSQPNTHEADFRRNVEGTYPLEQRPVYGNPEFGSLKPTLEEYRQRIRRYKASIDNYRGQLDAMELRRATMAEDMSMMRQAVDRAESRSAAAEHRCHQLSIHAKNLDDRRRDADDRCQIACDAQAEATRRYEETATLLYECLAQTGRQSLPVLPSKTMLKSDATKVKALGGSTLAAGADQRRSERGREVTEQLPLRGYKQSKSQPSPCRHEAASGIPFPVHMQRPSRPPDGDPSSSDDEWDDGRRRRGASRRARGR